MIDATRITAGLMAVLDDDPIAAETLRHESSATVNRHQLIGSAETPFLQLNTRQIAWVVIGQAEKKPDLSGDPFLMMLGVSAMLVWDQPILDAIDAGCGLATLYPWWTWTREFDGDLDALTRHLAAFADRRQAIAATCAVCRRRPDLVDPHLIGSLAREQTVTAYLQLLGYGLAGCHAAAVARQACGIFARQPRLLFAGDVDPLLAAIVHALSDDELNDRCTPLRPAFGDLAHVALAERHLAAGRHENARRLVADIRFLSPARPRAALVMAAIELDRQHLDRAADWIAEVEDPGAALRLRCRLAQARGDRSGYRALLGELHAAEPTDADAFVQLVLATLQDGDVAAAQQLCAAASEALRAEPQVAEVMAQVAGLRAR